MHQPGVVAISKLADVRALLGKVEIFHVAIERQALVEAHDIEGGPPDAHRCTIGVDRCDEIELERRLVSGVNAHVVCKQSACARALRTIASEPVHKDRKSTRLNSSHVK